MTGSCREGLRVCAVMTTVALTMLALGLLAGPPAALADTATHKVSGHVTNLATGNGLNGIPLTIDGDQDTSVTTATGPDGKAGYYEGSVRSGTYVLSAGGANGFSSATTDPFVVGETDQTVDLGLVRPGTSRLTGNVALNDGIAQTYSSGSLRLYNNDFTSTSDISPSTAAFALGVPDGNYSLQAYAYGYRDNPAGSDRQMQYSYNVTGPVTVDGDQDAPFTWKVRPLRIKVVDSSGLVVPNATVSASGSPAAGPYEYADFSPQISYGDWYVGDAVTDSAGQTTLPTLGGAAGRTTKVQVTAPDGAALANATAKIDPFDSSKAVTVTLPSARRLSGNVSLDDGIAQSYSSGSLRVYNNDFTATGEIDSRTAAFALAVPDGGYSLQAYSYGYRDNPPGSDRQLQYSYNVTGNVDVTKDQKAPFIWKVKPLRVKVVDSSGHLVPDATISASGSPTAGAFEYPGARRAIAYGDWYVGDAVTDAAGQTSLPTLGGAEGRTTSVQVTAPSGSALANATVKVDPFDSSKSVTVTLPSARRLTGNVVLDDGASQSYGSGSLRVYNSEFAATGEVDSRTAAFGLAVPDGSYKAQAYSYGYRDNPPGSDRQLQYSYNVTGNLDVTKDQSAPLTWRVRKLTVVVLDGDRTVPGVVASASGAPASPAFQYPGASANVDYGDWYVGDAVTDDSGRTTMPTLGQAAGRTASLNIAPPVDTRLATTTLKLPAFDSDTTIVVRYANGVPQAVAVDPASYSFGSQDRGSRTTKTVKVSTLLGKTINVSGAQLTGADAGQFDVTDDQCTGQAVPLGSSCTLRVSYVPSRSGAAAATLRLSDDGPGGPRTVRLSGASADTVKPTVQILSPTLGQTVAQDGVLLARYSCADDQGGSGLDLCAGDVADGQPVDTAQPGTHRFTVNAKDKAGNLTVEKVDYEVLPPDTQAPQVRIDAPTDLQEAPAGSTLLADYSCSDEAGGSGLASCAGTVADGDPVDTAAGPDPTRSFTVTAKDNAGNTTSKTVTYRVTDATKPTVDLRSPREGQRIRQNAVVDADFSCADEPGGSGLETCEGTVADGQPVPTGTYGPHDFTVTAKDKAGNARARTVSYFVTDQTAPVITIQEPRADLTVPRGGTLLARYSCADEPGGSGVDLCEGTVPSGSPLPTDEVGEHQLVVHATDKAGNQAPPERVSYTVLDVTEPTIDLRSPAQGARIARGSQVAAEYSCRDEAGGSGLKGCVGPVADGDPVDTAALGDHTFSVDAEDRAGNHRSESVTYTVFDADAPTVTVTSPTAGQRIPRGATVLAAYTCSDEQGGSGIETCQGNVANGQPLDTSALGTGTLTVDASDHARNKARVEVPYEVVDATKPTITLRTPGPGSTVEQGSEVIADYSCADEDGGSGIASCVGDVPSGRPLDTGPDDHSFTVTAKDKQGNETSQTVSYTGRDRIAPTATITIPASVPQGAQARVSYACKDNAGGSGIDTCVGDVPSSALLATRKLGDNTFTVTARDKANPANTSTTTVHYTVQDVIAPTVTINQPKAQLYVAPTRVSYECADADVYGAALPIESCVGTQPNQANLDLSGGLLAPHAFTVTATDKAGLKTTKTVNYTSLVG